MSTSVGISAPHRPKSSSRRFPRKCRSIQLPTDIIDRMDDSVPPQLQRHHSGPFDPVTRSSYLPSNSRASPLAALSGSTIEALAATPTSAVRDSVDKHVPLQNTAVVSPGEVAPDGTRLKYAEENLLADLGRWPGVDYGPGDVHNHGQGGWEGAFVGRGRSDRYHVDGLNKKIDKHDLLDSDFIMGLELQDQNGLQGMEASASAIEEQESKRKSGFVEGVKRRLSLKKKHDHDG